MSPFLFVVTILLLGIIIVPSARGDLLDDAIHRDMQRLNIRGASVLFHDENQSSESTIRSYGKLAASEDSANVTTGTAFMIASISKVFAGAAVAALIDQGILASLDEDICNVLPAQYRPDNINDPSTTGGGGSACRHPRFPNVVITWRMLVTHRSSLLENVPVVELDNGREVLPGYGPDGGYGREAAGNPTCPLKDVKGFYMDFMVDQVTTTSVGSGITLDGEPLNWYNVGVEDGGAFERDRPGSLSLYSNFAVGYIAALVEFATNQSFEDFCQEHIFAPLGMNHTSWFREELPGETPVAVPVEYRGSGRYRDYGHYCYIDYASGQLYTSVQDLDKFGRAMLKLGADVLWSEQIGKLYTTCQEQDENRNLLSNKRCDFAMNWILLTDEYRGDHDEYGWLQAFAHYDWTNGIMHDGSEAGSQTQLLILPKAGVYAAVLTNTDGNDWEAAQILTGVLADPTAPPLSAGAASTTSFGVTAVLLVVVAATWAGFSGLL